LRGARPAICAAVRLSGQMKNAGLLDGTPIDIDELRASACDAHHIIWWDHGGKTDMDNLALLYPHCHTKVHKRGYTVVRASNG